MHWRPNATVFLKVSTKVRAQVAHLAAGTAQVKLSATYGSPLPL